MKLRRLVYEFSWRSGFATLTRFLLTRRGRFALLFHGVSKQRLLDVPRDVQPHFTQAELSSVLAWLKTRFPFLTPEEFLASDKYGVLLTLDDGFANQFVNALPVLEQFHAPALFFVTTQHVQDPRNWLPATRRLARQGWGGEQAVPEIVAAEFYDGLSAQQLIALSNSPQVTIGSHTVSHPFLTQCEPSQLQQELGDSRRFLQELTGQPIDLFAYPTGDYNRMVAEAVRAAGYRAAFAVDAIPVGLPAYEIPRVGLYEAHPTYLSLKLSGLHRKPLKVAPLNASRI